MTDAFTPEYELEASTLNPFDITQFRQFLYENKIILVGVGIVLSGYLKDLLDSFYKTLVTPLFTKDNNENIFQQYIDSSFTVGGRTFKYGEFLFNLLKFIFTLYIMFLFGRFTSDLIN